MRTAKHEAALVGFWMTERVGENSSEVQGKGYSSPLGVMSPLPWPVITHKQERKKSNRLFLSSSVQYKIQK